MKFLEATKNEESKNALPSWWPLKDRNAEKSQWW